MGVKERIKIFAQHKGIPIYRFEELCSMSNGYVASIRKGLGLEKLENIQKAFPDLNRDWLLYGEGEMLNKIESQSIVAEPANNYTPNADVIDIDAEEIANFSLPFATNDIVQSREIDIRHLVETKSPKLERYPIGQKLAGVSYAQRIITEAMINADFYPGDVICLTYLEGKSQLLSGYAYLLDTKEYGALFRLVTINEDGTLLLESANPKFRPITLSDDDVRSYARLIMMVRTNFSFNRGAQFAETVRSRDEQIMKLTTSHRELITAQAQVLHNQAELIAELRQQNGRVDRERERVDKLTDTIINK